MTFEEWLNEPEAFGLRIERALDELAHSGYPKWTTVEAWLKAAYDVGRAEGWDRCASACSLQSM